MARFHVNPATGHANACRAKKKCPFGDLEKDHFDSKEAAQASFEHSQITIPKPAKASSKFAWPDESEKRVFKSKSGDVTVRLSRRLGDKDITHSLEAWLTVPGRGNVAFIALYARAADEEFGLEERLSMRDIETRPDSRRQGFAQEIREAMEKETGRPIYSSGSYTPEGWEAFGKHGGRYAESEVGGYGNEPGVKFDSMGFVASWKHQIPLNDDRRITYDREQRDAMYELSDKGVFKKFREGELIWAEE